MQQGGTNTVPARVTVPAAGFCSSGDFAPVLSNVFSLSAVVKHTLRNEENTIMCVSLKHYT